MSVEFHFLKNLILGGLKIPTPETDQGRGECTHVVKKYKKCTKISCHGPIKLH
jgi:hypothetical protein